MCFCCYYTQLTIINENFRGQIQVHYSIDNEQRLMGTLQSGTGSPYFNARDIWARNQFVQETITCQVFDKMLQWEKYNF